LEAAVAGRIGQLEDLAHPVVEALRAAVQEDERGVAGDELKIVGLDPGAAHRQLLRQRRQKHHLAVTGRGQACCYGERDGEAGTGQREQVALPQQRLLALVRNVGEHGCLPSTGKQAAVGRRRRTEAQESGRQIPICGMGEPGAGASCFCLSQREPGAEGDNDADEEMLAEDAPGEGDDHPGELVDGPEADELRIVEPTGNDVPVRHGDSPSLPDRQMTAVTTEVTIGTPVPTPMPTPTGTATWLSEKRPEARPIRPPARLRTVMILPPEPSRKSVNLVSAGVKVV